jgi:hypothetical protein
MAEFYSEFGALKAIAKALTALSGLVDGVEGLLGRSTNTKRLASAAASVNADFAKASPGTVRQISGYNASGTARYFRFYDKASAPTVASDAARKVLYLPPLSAFVFDMNDYFAVGIAYAITTGSADLDTGVLTAGDIISLNVDYL